jgi:hypothetical protein
VFSPYNLRGNNPGIKKKFAARLKNTFSKIVWYSLLRTKNICKNTTAKVIIKAG